MTDQRWPAVSVVIPTRNHAEFIRETLDSLLQQRYPGLEVIVMDGGSTDGTQEIVASYGEHIAHFESGTDGGQCFGIAKGMRRCQGEILAYLNSDDVLLPGALYAVGAFFRSHPGSDWVAGGCVRFSASGDHPPMVVKPGRSLGDWLVGCPIYQPATFWTRRAMDIAGEYPTDCRFSHDWHFWLVLASRGMRCDLLARPLAGFRVHGESATVSQQEAIQAEDAWLRSAFEPMLGSWESVVYRYRLRRHLCFQSIRNAEIAVFSGDTHRARKFLADGKMQYPPIIFSRSYRRVQRLLDA